MGGRVAGVDEVGRGPLAGPVLACAVMFRRPPSPDLAACLNDSKKLSPAARERAAALLLAEPGLCMALAAAPVAEIAARNILGASLAAMARAVARLAEPPDAVLVDGKQAPPVGVRCVCLVGGDGRSLSIAAASILAKVTRDRLMRRLGQRYPAYGWADNAGYGTALHRAAIIAHGATAHHRAGFGPLLR